MKTPRRTLFRSLFALAATVARPGAVAAAIDHSVAEMKEMDGANQPDVPLYSRSTKLGNLVFIMGIGAHFEGDIRSHTHHVLDELEKELIQAGSSMEKVLKVSVMLHDLNDYAAMNEVYKGRFGSKPPTRTTVAVFGGVPNGSIVEIDCIAHL